MADSHVEMLLIVLMYLINIIMLFCSYIFHACRFPFSESASVAISRL